MILGRLYFLSVMKKRLLILMLCFGFAKMAMAQKDSLALDEHSKYIYYRVINQGKDDANVLLVRGLDFFSEPYNRDAFKITAKDANTHTFEVKSFFTVSKSSSLAKHDDGKITYTLTVETRDKKYRYWLGNFVFTPYYKDRYNNMVPQPGVEIPMEAISKKIEAREAAHYLDECAAFGKKLGAKLKQYMDAEPVVKKADGKKVIDTKKW